MTTTNSRVGTVSIAVNFYSGNGTAIERHRPVVKIAGLSLWWWLLILAGFMLFFFAMMCGIRWFCQKGLDYANKWATNETDFNRLRDNIAGENIA